MPAISGLDVARPSATGRHVVEAAAQHGLDSATCLYGTGLTPADLLAPGAEITSAQEMAIVRNVIAHLGHRTGLGMEAGSRYSFADTGILGYALMSSPTFGDAIDVAWRYIALSASYLSLSAPVVTGTEAVVAIDDTQIPSDLRQFLIERDFGMVLRLLPMLVGSDHPPMSFRIELAQLTLPVETVELDNVTITVRNGPRNALVFPADLIDQPMPAADPQTAAICIRECEQLLDRRRARRGVAATVRTRIISNSAQMPSMADVAREMSITERTLHRRLTAEGTSFRALLDEVRATLAAELLDSGLTVEETARRLGYAEAAAFTRAHVRWTGHPPSRRSQGRGPDHHDGPRP
ncbi:AraC family transcriptional regulator [Mycobacterium sp. shizuoka-1]|uniref:AraC family transcriptional regulator n=1 Tax=Mycobacterium sp. shizuoka-1 TaxID=2039281 RepID=UPI000C0655DA|nr:AraC family transcriptional regulator [Mycobacterium sp. shizuoka-1]GAY17508.1 putative HTH-type transcriptional regulator [Mycobacterium sp. shizuoka-1]